MFSLIDKFKNDHKIKMFSLIDKFKNDYFIERIENNIKNVPISRFKFLI